MDNTSKTSGTEKVVKRGKTNGYKNAKLHAKWDRKRLAAQASKRHYQSLSVEERIRLVASRRGESKRELNRLYDLLDKQPTVKVAAPVANPVLPVEEKKVRTPKSKVVRTAKQVKPSKS